MINIESIVRPNVLNLKAYTSAREEFKGSEGIFLDANENPFGELNRYPDPNQKKLKQQLAKQEGLDCHNIFIGNGSDEVIDLAFRLFCNPGVDKAISFSPTYGMYAVSAALNDVELLTLPLNEAFQIDKKQLTPYLKDEHIKLIFICSPNNPTGNLMNRGSVEFIVENFKGVVILDEAYINFTTSQSCVSLISKYNNLIVSQTFSKAMGLAAARVGIAYADKEIIKFYNKVKPPYNVSSLNQAAALEVFENKQKLEDSVALIIAERERLSSELMQMNAVKKIYPSDANFLLIEVKDADLIYTALVEQQIITRNRSKEVENCIRISVGTPEENNRLLEAFKKIT